MRQQNYDFMLEWSEPHVTGGTSICTCTPDQAIEWVNQLYYKHKRLSNVAKDRMLVEFEGIHWSKRVPNKKGKK